MAINKVYSYEEALEKAANYCAYQERCHEEVRTKLLDWGMRALDLENILVHLIQENYLNEERFSKSFVKDKIRFQKWGRIKIQYELKRKKISDYCIQKAFEEISEEEYETILEDIIQKKMRQVKETNSFKRKQKIAAYAIQKGFESEFVFEILNRIENNNG